MGMIFGSARSDENYKASGGKAGDQRQTSSTNDKSGEVSMQSLYKHSKGWFCYRLKDGAKANKMASEMVYACNNKHIGYDQGQRTTLIKHIKDDHLTSIKDVCKDVETDCAQLVRAIIYVVCGVDVNDYASGGNFYTGNEGEALAKTGLFTKVAFGMTGCKNGDILVTQTKGHTGIVCSGSPRTDINDTTTTTTGGTGEMVSIELMTLCKDCSSEDVKLAKLLLNHHGAALDPANKNFGSSTESAVMDFQKAKSLDVDGIIGRQTWKALLTM